MQKSFNFNQDIDHIFSKMQTIHHSGIKLNESVKNYFGKLGKEKNNYSLPVTAFVIACKCPKLFKASLNSNNKFVFKLSRYPIYFKLGVLLDKYSRSFISLSPSQRIINFDKLKESLEIDTQNAVIKNLSGFPTIQRNIDFYTNKVVAAFENFCELFKNSHIPQHKQVFDKLSFKINNINLGGKIDLLVNSNKNEKYTLVDLKLKKFGEPIKSFKLPDFIQVLLYVIALKKKNIQIDSIGYYYFFENEIILEKIELLEDQNFSLLVENLVDELCTTIKFKPKKCELCLICPIKEKCSIGSKLTELDYEIPLV